MKPHYKYSSYLASLQKKIYLSAAFFPFIFSLSCSTVSSQQTSSPPEQSSPPPAATQLFYYPNKGQSQDTQERDQYECYLWASEQTGFDPSRPDLAPHHRVKVVPQPASGRDTLVGAAAGAVIGAAIGSPSNTAKGAVVGAVAGAVVGAASDASKAEQAEQSQKEYNDKAAARYADSEIRAGKYRRAMAACLEGRGYTVR